MWQDVPIAQRGGSSCFVHWALHSVPGRKGATCTFTQNSSNEHPLCASQNNVPVKPTDQDWTPEGSKGDPGALVGRTAAEPAGACLCPSKRGREAYWGVDANLMVVVRFWDWEDSDKGMRGAGHTFLVLPSSKPAVSICLLFKQTWAPNLCQCTLETDK